jgi:hypothetical protein
MSQSEPKTVCVHLHVLFQPNIPCLPSKSVGMDDSALTMASYISSFVLTHLSIVCEVAICLEMCNTKMEAGNLAEYTSIERSV